MPPFGAQAWRPPSRGYAPTHKEPETQRLASSAGVDSSLLEGLPADLLQVDGAQLRHALRDAVAVLQHGNKASAGSRDIVSGSLQDALAQKIAMLPLASRMPLLVKWGSVPVLGMEPSYEPVQSASSAPAGSLSAAPRPPTRGTFGLSFYDFDSLPGSSGAAARAAARAVEEERERERDRHEPKDDKRDRARERAERRRRVEAEAQREAEETERRKLKAQEAQQQRTEAVWTFWETTHKHQGEHDAEKANAVRREEEAKKAASDVIKAAAEAATRAAARNAQMQRFGENKKAHTADLSRAEALQAQAFFEAPMKASAIAEASVAMEMPRRSEASMNSHEGSKRHRRSCSRDREREGERRRSIRLLRSASAAGRRRHQDRSRSRRRRSQERSRSRARGRSRSSRSRRREGEGEGERSASRREGFTSGPPPVGVTPTAAPEPRLRQIGIRNGWAEFVDERTDARVYKNVLTGEQTNKQPMEYGAQISNVMNQRRLNWLAAQRNTAPQGQVRLTS